MYFSPSGLRRITAVLDKLFRDGLNEPSVCTWAFGINSKSGLGFVSGMKAPGFILFRSLEGRISNFGS